MGSLPRPLLTRHSALMKWPELLRRQQLLASLNPRFSSMPPGDPDWNAFGRGDGRIATATYKAFIERLAALYCSGILLDASCCLFRARPATTGLRAWRRDRRARPCTALRRKSSFAFRWASVWPFCCGCCGASGGKSSAPRRHGGRSRATPILFNRGRSRSDGRACTHRLLGAGLRRRWLIARVLHQHCRTGNNIEADRLLAGGVEGDA